MTKSNADAYYVEEFLYRGRPLGSSQPPAWHIIIGLNGTDPAGRPFPPLPIMTSEQALAAGWDLPVVLAEINQDLMAALEEERAKVATLEVALAEAAKVQRPEPVASPSASTEASSPV